MLGYRKKIDYEAWLYGLYEQRASFIAIINATGVNDKNLTFPSKPYGMDEDIVDSKNERNYDNYSELESDKEYRKKIIATQMF